MDHSYFTSKKAVDHSYSTKREKYQLKDHSYFTVGSKTPKVVQERRFKANWPESHQARDHCYVKASTLPSYEPDVIINTEPEPEVPVKDTALESDIMEERLQRLIMDPENKEKENKVYRHSQPKLDHMYSRENKIIAVKKRSKKKNSKSSTVT